MRPPRDLRRYVEPPLGEAEMRRALARGRQRLARRRFRPLVAAVTTLAIAGTAAAFVVPRLRAPSGTDTSAAARKPPMAERAASSLPAFTISPRPLAMVPARPASAVTDAIGLHVRLRYEMYADFPRVVERLKDLGVRHVYDVSGSHLDRLAQLGALGIRIHVLVEENGDPEALARALGGTLASLQADWRFGKEWRQGLLDEAWAARARRFAETLHRRVRAVSPLESVPLIGPSVRYPYESELVGDLSAFADAGAINYWPSPAPPEVERLALELDGQRRVFPGKDLLITQTGYSTAPLAIVKVSEAVQARYLLRTHLEALRRGVSRTFANHLFDFTRDPSAADFGIGLVRQDGTAKPAFGALKALLAAFRDSGPAPQARALGFALDSDEPDLRQMLFAKRDGSFLIAAWLARASEEAAARRPARLRLGTPPRAVRVFSPHGGSVLATQGTSELRIDVSDEITLIHVHP